MNRFITKEQCEKQCKGEKGRKKKGRRGRRGGRGGRGGRGKKGGRRIERGKRIAKREVKREAVSDRTT